MKRSVGGMASGIVIAEAVLIYVIGYNGFLLPGGVVLGGVTGLGSALYLRFGIPPGFTMLVLNIPMLVLAFRYCGKQVALGALWGTLLTSLAVSWGKVLPFTEDPLASAVFGGALMGFGVGLLLRRRITTGGTDLAAYLLMRKTAKPIGIFILVLDLSVVLFSAVLLWNFAGLLYSAMAIAVFSFLLEFGQKIGVSTCGAKESVL